MISSAAKSSPIWLKKPRRVRCKLFSTFWRCSRSTCWISALICAALRARRGRGDRRCRRRGDLRGGRTRGGGHRRGHGWGRGRRGLGDRGRRGGSLLLDGRGGLLLIAAEESKHGSEMLLGGRRAGAPNRRPLPGPTGNYTIYAGQDQMRAPRPPAHPGGSARRRKKRQAAPKDGLPHARAERGALHAGVAGILEVGPCSP